MAVSIPFLDPISYSFLVPEALSLCFLKLTGSHQQDPLYPWSPLWMPLPSSFSNHNLAVPWGHYTPVPGLSKGGCFLPTFLKPQSLQVGWMSLFLLFTISSPLPLLSSSVKLWALNHTKSDYTNSPSFWDGLGFWLLSFSITTVAMILGNSVSTQMILQYSGFSVLVLHFNSKVIHQFSTDIPPYYSPATTIFCQLVPHLWYPNFSDPSKTTDSITFHFPSCLASSP